MSPFPGNNEKAQMDLIFKAIGTPSEESWGPEVTKLPGWESVRKGQQKSQLRTIFKTWDPEALNLLESFLSPPSYRITAEEAVQHRFFSTEPLPQEISRLPKFGSVHEFDVKKKNHPRDEPSDHLNAKRQKITSIPPVVAPLLSSNLLPGMAAPVPLPPKPTVHPPYPKMANGYSNPKPQLSNPQGSHYAPKPNGPYYKPTHSHQNTGPHQAPVAQKLHVYPNGGYTKPIPNGKYHVAPNHARGTVPQTIVQKIYIPPQQDTASLHVYHNSAAK